MKMASGLAVVLTLMASVPALSTEGPASTFAEADFVRRSIQFAPTAGDLGLDVLTARDGCAFEGSDGHRSRSVWLLSRGGKAVAVTPLSTFAPTTGRPGDMRPSDRLIMAPAHGVLPLADGPAALERRLKRAAWGPEVQITLRCAPPASPSPRPKPTAVETIAAVPFQAAGVLIFSPVILFGVPSENASLVEAAAGGPSIAEKLQPGQPVPGGLEGFAREHREWVRVHADPGSNYAILTVDLGGKPRYGIGTPRDAAFFGVRNGVIEWRAGRGMGFEPSLCADRDGRFPGRAKARKGCSTTGYYSPRI